MYKKITIIIKYGELIFFSEKTFNIHCASFLKKKKEKKSIVSKMIEFSQKG